MRASCILAGAVLAGCSTYSEVSAGPVVAWPSDESASVGGGAAIHGGIGASSAHAITTFGVDANAKIRVTGATQNLSFGNGFLLTRKAGTGGAVTARAGLQLVFERFDDKLLVGGGPYVGLMGGVCIDAHEYFVPGHFFAHQRRDRTLLTFGPIAEVDARFSRPSAVPIVGFAFGIAWASEVVETGPNMPFGNPPGPPLPL